MLRPSWAASGIALVVTAQLPLDAATPAKTERATEWLMLTSGTSGVPKIVGHTLEALTGAIVAEGPARGPAPVWATFYDIRRYGGLQIFLRAILSNTDLRGANLTGVSFYRVRYDRFTRWPVGFDPARHGAVKVR